MLRLASLSWQIPLAPKLRGSQLMAVVEWGPVVGASADASGVGVPTDLDVFLRFAATDSTDCLVYYNSPSCGGAHLLRSDALQVPTTDDLGVDDAIE